MTDVRAIRGLLTGILVILAFGTIYFARDLFLPIVIGLLLALTLSPVVRSLARAGIPEAISSIGLIVALALVMVAGAYVLTGPISVILADAPALGSELKWKLSGLIASIEDVQSASKQVEEIASGNDGTPEVTIAQPGLLQFAAGSVGNFLGLTVVGLVLAMFILASGDLFYVKLVETFPTFSDKRRAVRTVRDIERQISHYFLAITAINACLGLAIGIMMYLLRLPNPVLWGVLAFALNFLPFIGAMIGTVLVAAYGVLSFDTLGAGLVPAVAYLGLTAIEGNFVTPAILGRRLELNVVSVFLTVIIWSWLWGIPGALMAVPFLVLLKVVSDNVPRMTVLGNFLGARAPAAARPAEMDG